MADRWLIAAGCTRAVEPYDAAGSRQMVEGFAKADSEGDLAGLFDREDALACAVALALSSAHSSRGASTGAFDPPLVGDCSPPPALPY
jgi:hypothetical protein